MEERYFSHDDIANSPDGDVEEKLARVFSEHLSAHRAAHNIVAPVGSITHSPPVLKRGTVRLPHLVAFSDEEGVRDVVLWECLPQNAAESWLGSKLPDQELVEQHLPDLLELRKRARQNTLDPTIHMELIARLVGRYISVRFVYQHLTLFQDIWDNT